MRRKINSNKTRQILPALAVVLTSFLLLGAHPGPSPLVLDEKPLLVSDWGNVAPEFLPSIIEESNASWEEEISFYLQKRMRTAQKDMMAKRVDEAYRIHRAIGSSA